MIPPRLSPYVWAGLQVLVFDQIFKHLARYFQPHLGGDYIGLIFHANSGTAFSLPLPSPWPTVMIILFLVGLLVVILSIRQSSSLAGPLLIILLAAASNGLDRVKYGAVIDYVYVGAALLNLADIAIVVGAAFVLSAILVAKNQQR